MDALKSLPQNATQVANKPNAGTKTTSKSDVYESDSVREVQARATHVNQAETPGERRGLNRLSKSLDHGQALRRDVPRGFYLNITV